MQTTVQPIRPVRDDLLRVGGAFTPGFLDPDPSRRLALFGENPFLEFGFNEWRKWEALDEVPAVPEFSLHLGRTAICEGPREQARYIDYVMDQSATRRNKPTSIGVHVTGDRALGGGSFGLHSYFSGTKEEEERAVRFLSDLNRTSGLPVWVENANCYSASARGILDAWQAVTRICEKTGSGLIVDLAHLYIDAVNCGVPVEVLLGAIPWSQVVELHLSGVRTGRDGTLHDGHSEAVHEGVWSLLDTVLDQRLITETEPVTVIVEHADLTWTDRADQYYADFARAESVLEHHRRARTDGAPDGEPHDYGVPYCRAYLRQLCNGWIPGLAQASEQRGLSYTDLFDQWVDDVRARGKRIVLNLDEIPPAERPGAVSAPQDLLAYAKEKLR
ncbi:DUF692 family multinuclear iron-containing protein [Streptomyces sp. NPDC058157]|uniref:multinuclear nonheme iron-dependent oxidase n=1 Tax=Streptomyces sp. NPDC058157 TaxID=3346360 RepID=UPI0036E7E89F